MFIYLGKRTIKPPVSWRWNTTSNGTLELNPKLSKYNKIFIIVGLTVKNIIDTVDFSSETQTHISKLKLSFNFNFW